MSDILLPPEPPRDRVVEAVDADGKFVELWGGDDDGWHCDGFYYEPGSRWTWPSIVYWAMTDGWSLRSVPAKELPA